MHDSIQEKQQTSKNTVERIVNVFVSSQKSSTCMSDWHLGEHDASEKQVVDRRCIGSLEDLIGIHNRPSEPPVSIPDYKSYARQPQLPAYRISDASKSRTASLPDNSAYLPHLLRAASSQHTMQAVK
jgi:hypothetical protein